MRRLFLLAAGVVAGMGLFAQDRRATRVDSGGEKRVSVLDQVVVTGASKAMRVREIPLAIQVVTGRQLDRSADNNVIDAIAGRVAGFAAVKTGPNVSKPFINGLGYNRVLTLYDGMRVETQQWGDEHGVPVDDYIIGGAEVIKGPASLLYGSDAIAGVLSLFPLLPRPVDGVVHVRVLSEFKVITGWSETAGYCQGLRPGGPGPCGPRSGSPAIIPMSSTGVSIIRGIEY